MNPPEDENSITIDPYGDRSLIIGDGKNQKRFLVSSNAMRLASPIWKSMFTGPYKEGTAKEIPFPEGKPDALSHHFTNCASPVRGLAITVGFPRACESRYCLRRIRHGSDDLRCYRGDRVATTKRGEAARLQGAWTDGVHATSNKEPCASLDKPLYLQSKDDVRP